MKERILIISAIFLMFCNCSMQETDTDIQMIGQDSQIYTAIIEDSSVKTFVDNKLHLFWTADDRISIFTDTYNQQYKFTGKTGDNSGNFEVVATGGFYTGSELSANYAIYPYSSATSVSYDGNLSVVLPSIQEYAENSFGHGANTMAAITNGVGDHHLRFQNVCGFLVVRLYGNSVVKSITFQGNNGEKIAGTTTISISYGYAPDLTMKNDATNSITLDCGTGITLGTTPDMKKEFWFCIPPTRFTKGFTITVSDTNGNTFNKSTSSSHTIVRNVVNEMTAIECDTRSMIPDAIDMGLSVKWASCNLGANSPEEYGDYYAWGAIEPWYEDGYAQEDPQNHWKSGKKGGYNWMNCKFRTSGDSIDNIKFSKYVSSSESSYWGGSGQPDNKKELDVEDDVAHTKLGGSWHIPTRDEFKELKDNCTITWTTINGIKGRKFKSMKTNNSIFLPAAGYRKDTKLNYVGIDGYYWSSSSLSVNSPYCVTGLYFSSSNIIGDSSPYRNYGLSVRPVSK